MHRSPRVLYAIPALALGSALVPALVACGGGNQDTIQDPPIPSASPSAVASAAPAAPATPVPFDPNGAPVPGIDDTALDTTASACGDFYQYACGGWIKATPVPSDESSWTRSFSVIFEKNQALLKDVLEADKAGNKTDAPYAKPLGDYYAACMDEDGIEKRGDADLKKMFAAVNRVTDAKSLAGFVGAMGAQGIDFLFDFDSGQDFKDATQVIGQIDQGGLSLPDRDYYLKEDEKMKDIRAKFVAHVTAMLTLAGEKPDDASKNAQTVLTLETNLAQASMSKEDRRDPKKVYHRIERDGLKQLAPDFAWDDYFKAVGAKDVTAINVATPDFFKALGDVAKGFKGDAADWRAYLKWHALHATAKMLPAKYVDEDFKFRSALTGAAKNLPRWKRCVRVVDAGLGEALAIPFVKQTLGDDGKATTKAMISEIEAAMQDNIQNLAWFDDDTRKGALEKLGLINNKVGFPDAWRKYDGLSFDRGAYLQDRLKADAFEVKRRLAKIGKPLDRTEWGMTPPTVNAYYDPSMNEMVFPAGILQPPFYANSSARAANYGGIGMVMGHELTHGFDDEGRQFDGHGNLKEWWTDKVSKDFDTRAACVQQQFDGYIAVDDVHLNGKLTLGENIADLGGMKLAYAALKAHKGNDPSNMPDKPKWSPDQAFFLGYAQAWCTNERPEYARLIAQTNPHSTPHWRVDGPLSNLPEFAKAFGCKDGDAMVKKDRCVVW